MTIDIRLKRDHQSDLIVRKPKLVAEVSSEEPEKMRWTELRLWSSDQGAYIVEQVGISLHEKERTRHRVWVCDTMEEVIGKLRRGWLARKLYDMVGIDDAEVVL